MGIVRESANDVDFSLRLYRPDGESKPEPLKNAEGATELADFVIALEIIESINASSIRASITIQDSAGLINRLKGGELWQLVFKTGNIDAGYNFYGYNIHSRSRSGNSEVYIVECVNGEFLSNEVSNVFGSSKQLFKKKNKAKDIITSLLKDNIGVKKNLHVEDSDNTHEFVATNWRVFDTIHWIAQRSIRPGTSDSPQNGYLFWETRMGFHFKSIDKMIADIKDQEYDIATNPKKGTARLYKYTYQPKKTEDEGNDNYRIDSISFPEDRNYLLALRNGSFAGFSTAFDPNSFANSELDPNTFSPVVYTFDKKTVGDGNPKVIDFWNKMEHLGGGDNPVNQFSKNIKKLVNFPRRIRYGVMANRVFDDKSNTKDKKQYSQLAYMQAYQHLRKQTLQNVQLLVKLPGNLDLYPGFGLVVDIPNTKPSDDIIKKDRKYSGKYAIAAVRHIFDGKTLVTECLLYRDSFKKDK